jgi:hypothetical protein
VNVGSKDSENGSKVYGESRVQGVGMILRV